MLGARGKPLLERIGVRRIPGRTLGLECLKAGDHRIVEPLKTLHVEHNDARQARQPIANLEHLVELLVIFDKQNA